MALVGKVERGMGIAMVVLQHHSPDFPSLLPLLLTRGAHMDVCEIAHLTELKADTIFVAPAGFNVLLRGQRFTLQRVTAQVQPRPSINLFLTSLSLHRESAVAVILSGAGSDGAKGVVDIKAAGGVVLVQDPESATFKSMPQAAIDKGCVDQALAPEEIAKLLHRLALTQMAQAPLSLSPTDETLLQQLFEKVQHYTRADLSSYKEATLWRRLNRRMVATRQGSLEAYVQFVESNPSELDAMANEILISVTSFYRDATAFEALQEALPSLLASRDPQELIRIWVAGCATGEEAYTVAMLVMECLASDVEAMDRVRVFATDIDMAALAIARAGVYSANSVKALPPYLCDRYLSPHSDGFEVNQTLRKVVRFAKHDLVQDPPFVRVDLICCRNVLIYFQVPQQQRIFQAMHFALKPGGLLFLGRAETIVGNDQLFSTQDRSARLYRRSEIRPRLPTPFVTNANVPLTSTTATEPSTLLEQRLRAANERLYAPPSLLLDPKGNIQQVQGDISPFTRLSAGAPTLQLASLIIKPLQVELTVLLHRAREAGKSVFGRVRAPIAGSRNHYRLAVHPEPMGQDQWYVVAFEKAKEPSRKTGTAASESELATSNTELATNQTLLQSAVVQLGLNDREIEIMAADLQASNEELQTSNEELHTANEELQSTTEELSTVNEELQVRTLELANSVSDLENTNNSIGIPVLVLGRDFMLHRYNRVAAALLGLTASRTAKRLDPAGLPEALHKLDEWVDSVIENEQPRMLHVEINSRRYLLQIRPYDAPLRQISLAVVSLIDQTELLVAGERLAEDQSQLQATLDNSPAIVALKDPSGRYIYVNPKFAQFFRLTSEHCLGKTDPQLFPNDLADQFRSADLEVLRHSAARETEHSVSLPTGSFQLLAVRFPLFATDGAISLMCMQATDITARKDLERSLRLAATVFEQSPSAILITDPELVTVSVNHSFKHITGHTEAHIVGREPLSMLAVDPNVDPAIWEAVREQGAWHGELSCRRPTGEPYPAWVDIATAQSATGQTINYMITLNDLSPIAATRQRAEFLATHDALTELPNRRLFSDRLDQAVKRCQRQKSRMALLFLDLDHFKYINDTLGHEFGDALLKQSAALFRGTLRDSDTVARLGGDEFAIIMERTSEEDVRMACERLLQCFREPLVILDEPIHMSVSIGIAMGPDDGDTTTMLMRNADSAMYRAKAQGRSGFYFYSAEMRKELELRHALERDLRKALANQELHMVYQPQVRLDNGTCVGVESLLRWQHPTRGAIDPQDFIGVAEETDLIDAITLWVCKEVISQISIWSVAGQCPPRVSINISPRNFRRMDLSGILEKLTADAGVEPSRLCLEVTETLLLDRHPSVSKRVDDVLSLGVQLSLDDFGTGYSSISELGRLPIKELKLDSAFTQRVTLGEGDSALAMAIVMLAAARKLELVAEGIETAEQVRELVSMGVSVGQGFFFSAGVSGAELPEVLKQLTQRGKG